MLYEIFDVTHPYFKWKVLLMAISAITFVITVIFDNLLAKYERDKYLMNPHYRKNRNNPKYNYFYKHTCGNVAYRASLIFVIVNIVYAILSIMTFNYWTLFKFVLCSIPFVLMFRSLRDKKFRFWAVFYVVAFIVIFAIGIFSGKYS